MVIEVIEPSIHENVQQSLRDFFKGFKCQKCGGCCQWDREVPLWEHEAKRLGRIQSHFLKYTYMRNGWTFLKMPCVFYSKFWKKCRIYKDRPIACKLFPTAVELDGSLKISQTCPAVNKII